MARIFWHNLDLNMTKHDNVLKLFFLCDVLKYRYKYVSEKSCLLYSTVCVYTKLNMVLKVFLKQREKRALRVQYREHRAACIA